MREAELVGVGGHVPSGAVPFTLDLSFARHEGRAVLTRRRYRWPVTVGRLFPATREGAPAQLIVQNAGAALQPGDRVRRRLSAADDAAVEVRGQGAMPVTGGPDRPPAHEETHLTVTDESVLADLPEPRLLLPHASLDQTIDARVEEGSLLVLTDALIIHPEVTPETFGRCTSRAAFRTTASAHPAAVDAQCVTAPPPRGCELRAFATLYVVAPGHVAFLTRELPPVVAQIATSTYASVTTLPGGMGCAVRMAARDGGALRTALAALARDVCASAQTRVTAGWSENSGAPFFS